MAGYDSYLHVQTQWLLVVNVEHLEALRKDKTPQQEARGNILYPQNVSGASHSRRKHTQIYSNTE